MTVVIFFGIVALIGLTITSKFNDNVQANANLPTDAKTASTTMTNHYSGVLSNGMLILLIGMCLVALGLAALVRVHPVFLIFYFIGLLIVIFMSGAFSNIYQTMAANTNLITYADQLIMIGTVITYLPWFITIFGTLLAVVMYKSWRNAQI